MFRGFDARDGATSRAVCGLARRDPFFPMLHEQEKANVQQALDRTRAAIGALSQMAGELRVIRKGMAPTVERDRVAEMLRLNEETVAALERKLALLRREAAGAGVGR
jgi:hypothetical protein